MSATMERGLGLHVVASGNQNQNEERRETKRVLKRPTQVMLVATERAWPIASDNLLNQSRGTRNPKKENMF